MKQLVSIPSILVFIVAVVTFQPSLASDSSVGFKIYFARDLLDKLKTEAGPNLICSPLSIQGGFGMLLEGVRSRSADQLRQALRLSSPSPQAENQLGQMLSALPTSEDGKNNAIISLANRVYVQAGYKLKKEFLITIKNDFKAEVGQVDLKDSVKAAAEINQWVKSKTNDKIKDLIPSSGIDPDSRLILVNAVYFKGLWKIPFKVDTTFLADFHTSPTKTYKVKMMSQIKRFSVTENEQLGVQVVSLPFEGDQFSMLVLLPTQMGQLTKVEQKLTGQSLADLINQLKPTRIELQLPRFKVESQFDLKKAMKNLGARDIFDSSTADLSGISSTPLYVSQAIHKAYLDLNENGVEAAAATAIDASSRSLGTTDSRMKVIVNHPFLVAIYDHKNKAIAFIGRVTEPTKSTSQ